MERPRLIYDIKDQKHVRVKKRMHNLEKNHIEVYRHSLKLTNESEDHIATVTFEHCVKPFDFYYVCYIDVCNEFRGKGIGRNIVNQINHFLSKNMAIGVLKDGIAYDDSNDERSSGMYQRLGWKPFYHWDNSFLIYRSKNVSDKYLDGLYAFLIKYIYV
jgi:GNAT superfamily N-acetyltransferase